MKALHIPLLSCVLLALAGPAGAGAVLNNLQQLGSGANNLRQIGLAIHGAGTYVAGDGSVRTLPDDGSVRFISVGSDSRAAFCFRNVRLPGPITDGTSNTIVFNQRVGLPVVPGFVSGPAPIGQILDGTSNTIEFGEGASAGVCLGNTVIDEPEPGNFTDGTSNTIVFGDGSSFDVCFANARIGTIADGTSNTILLGESHRNVCYDDIQVAGDLTVTGVAEPASLVVLLGGTGAMAGAMAGVRRRSRRPWPRLSIAAAA